MGRTVLEARFFLFRRPGGGFRKEVIILTQNAPQDEAVTVNGVMSILLVGDVVGKAGRRILQEQLAPLKEEFRLDCAIVNGENAASGIGLTPALAKEMFKWGADIITSGNHVWNKREIYSYIKEEPRLLRPYNYPPQAPGRGATLHVTDDGLRVGVLNLLGRVFMDPVDCPFRAADAALEEMVLGRDVDALIVDFHGEATSEKVAMGRYLDGRVSAVLGTHTHIPTADHMVLKGGTGYQTDVGMTGCYDSVIGMKEETVMRRFLDRLPSRFEPAAGPGALAGAVVRINLKDGLCREVVPVRRGGFLERR